MARPTLARDVETSKPSIGVDGGGGKGESFAFDVFVERRKKSEGRRGKSINLKAKN